MKRSLFLYYYYYSIILFAVRATVHVILPTPVCVLPEILLEPETPLLSVCLCAPGRRSGVCRLLEDRAVAPSPLHVDTPCVVNERPAPCRLQIGVGSETCRMCSDKTLCSGNIPLCLTVKTPDSPTEPFHINKSRVGALLRRLVYNL